ncbi:dorsal-ventral patterning tolloid-like protein 1 [Contarinia nasturtii]|uniref:dorsal-ventral patterning tolloid-like protein 1 n=1 Tax=Contarinia nasturtii TaxID=265458 RepID=UPI0012D44222|nr:dorsal-ventral patterning tolloid-like protein 1 [Contarinia nasturtii]
MSQVYNSFWVKCVLIVFFGVLMQENASYVLIEGDKMDESSVGSVQTPQVENVRSKRTIMNKKKLWKFGVIPYEIDMTAGFDFNQIDDIKAAMKHWEVLTCIIFVERHQIENLDYIRFTKILECTCCSDIGNIGDRQVVGVTNCGGVGGIIHEIGHVIGFHHEFQRPDRDEYIEIIEDEPSYEDLFLSLFFDSPSKKLSPGEFDTLGEPYDFDSIMHEYIETFTVQPKERKNGIVPKMGRNERLSAIDIRKTKKLYKCPECGKTYSDKTGAFTSPQYYNNNSINRKYYCEWRIKAIKGERILLDITDLDTFDSSNCLNDYLEIYDGYWHKSPLLARFCGAEIPGHIASSENHMFIIYVSNQTEHEHRGFAANYETFHD